MIKIPFSTRQRLIYNHHMVSLKKYRRHLNFVANVDSKTPMFVRHVDCFYKKLTVIDLSRML